MKTTITLISSLLIVMLLASCSNNTTDQMPPNSAETVAAIVNATLSAIPTTTIAPTTTPIIEFTPTAEVIEETPTLSIPTNTPVGILAPLYWELTWENSGRSEQTVPVNQQSSEQITLFGYTYQAPLLPSNDNVYAYYSNENMANMGWMFIGGWGGPGGILTVFYNEKGYFLTISYPPGTSNTIIVWISDETAIVPVIPTVQN